MTPTLTSPWVGGSVLLHDKFSAKGTVNLLHAQISGMLCLHDAHLAGRNEAVALGGLGMAVRRDMICHGLTAEGMVWLSNAEIGGDLNWAGSHLISRGDSHSLLAIGLKVGKNLLLTDRGRNQDRRLFVAAGPVRLSGSDIAGDLICRGASLSGSGVALDAAGLRVEHELAWEPEGPVTGKVILQNAVVDQLSDAWTEHSAPANGYWPSAALGKLLLDGFSYSRIGGRHRATLQQRLTWIGSQPKHNGGGNREAFTTQPYEQLAKVYRKAGQDREARTVAIARRRDVRRYGDLTPSRRLGNWFLDVTIRYGYQTWRAVAGLVILYLVVLGLFWFAQHQSGTMVPAGLTLGIHPFPVASHCTSAYPCFYPPGYAFDTVVPLVNVQQAENWRPDPSAPFGWVYLAIAWIGTILGWALVTLVVAGYTGLVRSGDSA